MQRRIGCLSLFALVAAGVAVQAQEPKSESKKKTLPPWQQLCETGMKKNIISPASRNGRKFTRLEQPVLIHSQSIRDDQLGAVYLWVDDQKRPVAIADGVVAPDPERPGTHYFVQEFHSLYPEPIVGRLGAVGKRWAPRAGGLTWERLPGLTTKPKSEKLMVVQTRELTRKMKAHGIDWRRENQKQPYRFLSKPLYTYEIFNKEKDESTMGCVFVFCLSIDPEIIYSVEARTSQGTTTWYQSFAALSDMGLFVEKDGASVWSESPVRFSDTGPHTAIGQVNLKLPAASN